MLVVQALSRYSSGKALLLGLKKLALDVSTLYRKPAPRVLLLRACRYKGKNSITT